MGLWSVNKTFGCFIPRIKNSFSGNVYKMAVHSFTSVESLSYACVKILILLNHLICVWMSLQKCCANTKLRSIAHSVKWLE